MTPTKINVLTLLQNGEHYVFLYDDASSRTVRRVAFGWAANPALSFTWDNATAVRRRVRAAIEKDQHATSCRFASEPL